MYPKQAFKGYILMKTMPEYIEAAYRLLEDVWADAVESNITDNLDFSFPDWTPDERKDLLMLCAALALCEAQGARDVTAEAERRGLEVADAARLTSRQLLRFLKRESSASDAIFEPIRVLDGVQGLHPRRSNSPSRYGD
jgi:hypothetical protein